MTFFQQVLVVVALHKSVPSDLVVGRIDVVRVDVAGCLPNDNSPQIMKLLDVGKVGIVVDERHKQIVKSQPFLIVPVKFRKRNRRKLNARESGGCLRGGGIAWLRNETLFGQKEAFYFEQARFKISPYSLVYSLTRFIGFVVLQLLLDVLELGARFLDVGQPQLHLHLVPFVVVLRLKALCPTQRRQQRHSASLQRRLQRRVHGGNAARQQQQTQKWRARSAKKDHGRPGRRRVATWKGTHLSKARKCLESSRKQPREQAACPCCARSPKPGSWHRSAAVKRSQIGRDAVAAG
uniref:(northern house mosquito) hypothetical protein n=1 Tax=Culex pipiens TaxID=7175 RepID=A0A8D8BHF2_CULPI